MGPLDLNGTVLTHFDFWCGNALWDGDHLRGVVDWSGARDAPRGVDVAWCRLDLVLLGSVEAADQFTAEYEREVGSRLRQVAEWDRQAAAQAIFVVESWAPNYHGIGRTDLTRKFSGSGWTPGLRNSDLMKKNPEQDPCQGPLVGALFECGLEDTLAVSKVVMERQNIAVSLPALVRGRSSVRRAGLVHVGDHNQGAR